MFLRLFGRLSDAWVAESHVRLLVELLAQLLVPSHDLFNLAAAASLSLLIILALVCLSAVLG